MTEKRLDLRSCGLQAIANPRARKHHSLSLPRTCSLPFLCHPHHLPARRSCHKQKFTSFVKPLTNSILQPTLITDLHLCKFQFLCMIMPFIASYFGVILDYLTGLVLPPTPDLIADSLKDRGHVSCLLNNNSQSFATHPHTA